MAYASKYYDPQKAHEYYMRTRKLKGRKKGSAAAAPVGRPRGKAQPKAKPKPKTPEQKAAVRAKQRAQAITNKLQAWSKQHSKEVSRKAEKIRADAAEKIDKMPPIPKGLLPETRARIAEGRRKRAETIQAHATQQIKTLQEKSAQTREAKYKNAAKQRKQVAKSLKSAIQKAREKSKQPQG